VTQIRESGYDFQFTRSPIEYEYVFRGCLHGFLQRLGPGTHSTDGLMESCTGGSPSGPLGTGTRCVRLFSFQLCDNRT
jgi:hypothetical protein